MKMFFLLSVVLLSSVDALIQDLSLPSRQCWVRAKFFYLPNGHLQYTSRVNSEDLTNNASVTVFLCSDGDASQYFNGCPSEVPSCQSAKLALGTEDSGIFVAPFKGKFYGGILMSNESLLTGWVRLVLVNPNGQHLGYDEIPLLFILPALIALWALMTIAWIANWVMFRHQHIGLHRLLTLVPLVKCGDLASVYAYYLTYSKTGLDHPVLLYVYMVLSVIYQAVFIAALVLIAKGWQITRLGLAPLERRLTVATVVLYATSSLLYSLSVYVDVLADIQWLAGAVSFVVIASYLLALAHIFLDAYTNVRALRYQLALIRNAHIDPKTTPAYTKLQMFLVFRWAVTLYVVLDVISQYSVLALSEERAGWAGTVVREVPALLLFGGLGLTFRLRSFGPYLYMMDDTGQHQPSPLYSAPVSTTDPDGAVGSALELRTWRPGMALPEVPPQQWNARSLLPASSDPRPVIVIQNPTSSESDSDHGRVSLHLGVPVQEPLPPNPAPRTSCTLSMPGMVDPSHRGLHSPPSTTDLPYTHLSPRQSFPAYSHDLSPRS